MMFAHIHSTKEKLYGLFNLHVQLDFTIGENKLLQKKIEKKQAENQKLRNSIEFKIGKGILKPFRAIKKLFK